MRLLPSSAEVSDLERCAVEVYAYARDLDPTDVLARYSARRDDPQDIVDAVVSVMCMILGESVPK